MLKRFLRVVCFGIILSLLTGCSNTRITNSGSQRNTISPDLILIDEISDNLFDLKLYIDRTQYKVTDKIIICATLEYIGDQSEIIIWSGIPYIHFFVSDGKDFNLGGITFTVLEPTTLKKGQVYKFDFKKNGGFSEDDPKAEFWRKFYSEKDLFLPQGKYNIKVSCAFSLTQDTENSKYTHSEEIDIEVD